MNGNGGTDVPQWKDATQWAAIAGHWTFDGAGGVFSANGSHDERSGNPFGIALSSHRVRDGAILLDVRLSDRLEMAGGVVLGFESIHSPYTIITLGGWDRAYSIGQFLPEVGWRSVELAGMANNLDAASTYHLAVRIAGQRVEFSVDDVLVLQTTLPSPIVHAGFGLYAYGPGNVTYRNVRVKRDRLRAFVIMPFKEPFDSLYRDVIKPVADAADDVEVLRADDIKGPGLILDDIRRQIDESHLVVAEISEWNPNVFYELGHAHAIGKPTILLVRDDYLPKLPFDVRGYRAIVYKDSIAGKKDVESELRQHLRAISRA
ncbi:MAG: DUF1080 domain-containing protein [Pirellulales bacterium]|nr:DUF1080 domain-containing protein [Pirellulales bacterium]